MVNSFLLSGIYEDLLGLVYNMLCVGGISEQRSYGIQRISVMNIVFYMGIRPEP